MPIDTIRKTQRGVCIILPLRKTYYYLDLYPYSRRPASLTTFPIVAISDLIVAASCSGELATTSIAALKSRSFTSALLRARTISWFSRLMIAAGVLAGANKAVDAVDSYPGRPAAAIVGRPGANADGLALATAKALNRPNLTHGMTTPALPNCRCTWPAIRSLTACADRK